MMILGSMLEKNGKRASEEEREEMGAIVSEYQSFWNGHTDEMRRIDWENNHVYS